MSPFDRRSFLRSTGGAMAALTAAQYSRVLGANERIGVAVIGLRGRGRNHIQEYVNHSSSEVAAIVDIDQAQLERASAYVQQLGGAKPREYRDYRKMLESKDFDAVSIATPNHWHALMTIDACRAGKDVYVEKPASHNVWEGRKMVEAVEKYKRIVQVGMQSRSTPHKIEAMEQLRKGLIGEVYMSRGLCFKRRKTIGSNSPAPVPPGIEYDLWLGPAANRKWQENRFHYNWHWYWDTGNGDIGNQGVHEMDVARWGLGKDYLPPEVYSAGGKYIYDDDQETPNTQQAIFNWDGKQVAFEVRGLFTGGECGLPERPSDPNTIGVIFFGSEGYLSVSNGGYWSYLGEKREPGPSMDAAPDTNNGTKPHVENFLQAVKSRNPAELTCPVIEGHLSAAMCHLANISYRTGHRLDFDHKAERFTNSEEANKLLKRKYREPYVIPEEV